MDITGRSMKDSFKKAIGDQKNLGCLCKKKRDEKYARKKKKLSYSKS